MKKVSELVGLPLISKKDGERIARVKDIIYSQNKQKILAFLTSEGGFFREGKVVYFRCVEAIGKDALMVKDKSVIEKADTIPNIDELIEQGNKIIGEEVIVDNGESMGFIKDIIYDDEKGKLLGFVLTDGIIQDMMDGRNVLPFIRGIVFGEEALVISAELKEDFDKNKEELKKLLGV